MGPHRFHTENPNVKALLDQVSREMGPGSPAARRCISRANLPLASSPATSCSSPSPRHEAGWDLFTNSFKTYDTESFESYVLRQYGPTLYREFFQGYSQKFLGLHPRETHPDWAKVGINRAIIDDKVQMQNLSQLLKSTLLQYNKDETHFSTPTRGMQQAWGSPEQHVHRSGRSGHPEPVRRAGP